MSLPARMGTNVSASALVRVKCGSMWITLAPRAFASTTHWNPTGMGLGHVRAHDHDAVGVDEPVRSVGGAATPERGSQTGNGGGVSNTGLVLDLDGTRAR